MYYIIACIYKDNRKSYVTNVDPLVWSSNILMAKRFQYKDDLINDLRFNMEDLYNLKYSYDYVDNIVLVKFNENDEFEYMENIIK